MTGASVPVTERVFTSADQEAFALFSGDNNPLHMDPVAARRYLFGRPVVHGIHLVLWALDDQVRRSDSAAALQSLKVQFMRPVGVNEAVELRSHGADASALELSSGGVVCTKIRAVWSAPPADGVAPMPQPGVPDQ